MRLSVAQAAREVGVTPADVRAWERALQLRFPKDRSGRRVLGSQDLENLRVVAGYVAEGRSLEEIRTLLGRSVPQVETRPDLDAVLARIIQRQDALEQVLSTQHGVIQDLQGRYLQIAAAQDAVRGLLEGPGMDPARIEALSQQVSEMAEAGASRLSELERQLDDVRKALDGVSDAEGPEAFAALQARLAQLEEDRRTRAEAFREEDAAREDALRTRLAELERDVSGRARQAMEDQVRSLQRRMLDLEAAMASRSDAEPGEADDLGLVEGVVRALEDAEARRRPWWRFWS